MRFKTDIQKGLISLRNKGEQATSSQAQLLFYMRLPFFINAVDAHIPEEE